MTASVLFGCGKLDMRTIGDPPDLSFFSSYDSAFTCLMMLCQNATLLEEGTAQQTEDAMQDGTLDLPNQINEPTTASNESLPDRTEEASGTVVAKSALPVRVMAVDRVDSYTFDRHFTGSVKAARESQLSFERVGKLTDVFVDKGDRVKRGQVLANLDIRRLEAKRDALRARQEQAEAILDELVDGPRREAIAAQRSVVRSLEADVEFADQAADRQQRLQNENATARQLVEQTRSQANSVRSKLRAAKSKLEELESGTRSQQIDAQEAVTRQLAAELLDVEIEISDSQLVAPYDAFVNNRMADEGTIVSPGMPVLELIEDTEVEVWVGLPPATARQLAIGKELQVEILEVQLTSQVRAVDRKLDPDTLTQTIVLNVNNTTPAQMPAGEIARVTISQEVQQPGCWVPLTALKRTGQGLWALVVVKQSDGSSFTTQFRDVQIVHQHDDQVLVDGAIGNGEQILADGVHRIAQHQTVAIVDDATGAFRGALSTP